MSIDAFEPPIEMYAAEVVSHAMIGHTINGLATSTSVIIFIV